MNRTVLVQGAVHSEIEVLRELFHAERIADIKGYEFYESSCNETKIILMLTKIGMTNAAIATTIAIERFHPDVVINQGTAGGAVEAVVPGDIVVGCNSVHINEIFMPQKGKGEGCDPFAWEKGPRTLAGQADDALLRICRTVPYAEGKLFFGTLGSGDLYSGEADRISWLHDQHGHLCEDEESAAVYKTSQVHKVPVIGLRVISNNELICVGNDDYETARPKLQRYVHRLIQAITEAFPKEEYIAIDEKNRIIAAEYITKYWKTVNMVLHRKMTNVSLHEGFMAMQNGEPIGVCMYTVDGDQCEITLLDAGIHKGKGIGTELVGCVKETARKKGCKRLYLVTTNDNIEAILFYQRRGFDLVRVYYNEMDEVRKMKPSVSLIGSHGVPLKHDMEFSMEL